MHGGVQLVVAQDGRHLLDGHAVPDQVGGRGAPEFVRVYVLHLAGLAQLGQHEAHAVGRQPVRSFADEQGRACYLSQ